MHIYIKINNENNIKQANITKQIGPILHTFLMA